MLGSWADVVSRGYAGGGGNLRGSWKDWETIAGAGMATARKGPKAEIISGRARYEGLVAKSGEPRTDRGGLLGRCDSIF